MNSNQLMSMAALEQHLSLETPRTPMNLEDRMKRISAKPEGKRALEVIKANKPWPAPESNEGTQSPPTTAQ